MNISENVVGTLRAQDHGHPPVVLVTMSYTENHYDDWCSTGVSNTIRSCGATCGGGVLIVAVEKGKTDEREKLLGEKPVTAFGFKPRQSSTGGLGFEKDKAPTLVADREFCQGGVLVIMESVSADGTEKVLRPA